MNNDKHYHPAIHQRLQSLVGQGDWQGLLDYLATLSHAHFRTAGYMLGERIVPTLDESEAWELVTTLVSHNAKAFLVTMLKAIRQGMADGQIHLRTNGGRTFLAQVKQQPIDTQKTLLELLPSLGGPEDVNWLFRKLEVEEGEARLPYLLRTATLPCSYALLHTLRYIEHNRPLLVRTTLFLVKRGDELGFNMASLLKAYYGLEEVKGTFSLHLEPYKLARIEASYEAFCETMRH